MAGRRGSRGRRVGGAIFLLTLGLGIGLTLADALLPSPDPFRPPLSPLVLDRRGEPLRLFQSADDKRRLPADLDRLDADFLRLLVAYEDARFWSHPGIDPLAALRALGQTIRLGQVVSGASTIPMQLARLLDPRPRTVKAKLIESFRALQLVRRYDRRTLLARYLTLAPYGGNLEGVRAAAWAYLGREPMGLTLAESALLIALPQAPEARRPDRHPAAARAAVVRVLDRLAAQGAITEQAAAEAKQDPLPNQRRPFPALAPHATQALLTRLPMGADPSVPTTLDAGLQRAFEGWVTDAARRLEPGATIALLAVETQGRAVRVAIGGHGFFDREAKDPLRPQAGQVDMLHARRSPGSLLKPFIYGLAFDDRLLVPETRLIDAPLNFGSYAPRNFDRQVHGEISVRDALRYSLNLPAVAVLDRVGPARFAAALRNGGADLRFLSDREDPALPLALGSVGISLADLVRLYAALGEGGLVRPLVWQPGRAEVPATRLVTAPSAAALLDILSEAPRPPGIALAADAQPDGGRAAFKTGTSYGFRDAWAIGLTPRWTVGVWVGRPDGTPRPGAYGLSAAAPILLRALDLLPVGDTAWPTTGGRQRRAAVPAALNRFAPSDTVRGAADRARREALRIQFPPSGSALVAPRAADGTLAPVPLFALGGVPPYRWYVNDAPLSATATELRPDGLGFFQLRVVDAEGGSAEAAVRLLDQAPAGR